MTSGKVLECDDELLGMSIAIERITRGTALENLDEVIGYFDDVGDIRERFAAHLLHDLRPTVGIVGVTSREQREERRAHGPDVTGRPDSPQTIPLLGRHATRRSHGHVRDRQGRLIATVSHVTKAKIRELDLAITRDHDVIGLDVPMNDLPIVRSGQSTRCLENNRHCLARPRRPLRATRSRAVSPLMHSMTR